MAAWLGMQLDRYPVPVRYDSKYTYLSEQLPRYAILYIQQ